MNANQTFQRLELIVTTDRQRTMNSIILNSQAAPAHREPTEPDGVPVLRTIEKKHYRRLSMWENPLNDF